MNNILEDLKVPEDVTLEQLLSDHMALKRKLGPNNALVQVLWAEIRRRRNEN